MNEDLQRPVHRECQDAGLVVCDHAGWPGCWPGCYGRKLHRLSKNACLGGICGEVGVYIKCVEVDHGTE